jgi:exosortase
MTTLVASRGRVETTASVVLGAAVVALYLPVLRDLFGVWVHGTYYSYGPLVPLFSAYLAREGWTASTADGAPETQPAGFLLTAAGLVVLAVGQDLGSLTLRALSLPVVLMGLVVGMVHAALARRLAFPIGFLIFMAPLPDGAVAGLSLPLQQLAAFVAEHVLRALGVHVVRDGLFVAIPSVTLHVTEACNGLRFLFAMLVIGTAFAGTMPQRPLRRVALVVGAVLLSILANLARVTGTGVMAELWGARAAVGLIHVIWGKVVYAAALVPFAGLVLLMRRR